MMEWFIWSQLILMGIPNEEAWKPGIQFSMASMTSLTIGFLWNCNPQHTMLGGTLLDLVDLAHSRQIVSPGTSLMMAQTPFPQP
jgi:hypothetical protein